MRQNDNPQSRKSRFRRRVLRALLIVFALVLAVPIGARLAVNRAASGRIHSVSDVPACRVAMVLGARVLPDGRLSPLLRDRCDLAIELYKSGKVKKLLMTGDNRFKHYNEPERMREYAIAKGVPAEDVVADYAGRRTFDSMYRAKHIFGLDRLIVVTQDFHAPRAIYLARAVGVEAYGVSAPTYYVFKNDVREYLACVSAVLDVHVLDPKPIMGEREKI